MGKIKKNSRGSRQKRRMRVHKRSMLAVGAVIILLTAVSVSGMTLRAKEKSYKAQAAELEQQIEEEKKRTKEIDKLETYVGTDTYVEDMAREKLGMVYKDETVFKAK